MAGERATGIVVNGETVDADVVVSGLGVPQTILRLLDGHVISDRVRHRIQNIHYDRGQLLWANLALHEAPDYGIDGVGPQPRLYWGPKDPDYIATRYQPEIYLNGFASRPFALSSRRHAVGPVAGAGGQAPGRRRGVRGAAAAVLRLGATSRSASARTCCRSGSSSRRT